MGEFSMAMKMAMKWKDKRDVDQTVYEIRSTFDRMGEIPPRVAAEIKDLADNSEPALVKYFWNELTMYDPDAVSYFEERI